MQGFLSVEDRLSTLLPIGVTLGTYAREVETMMNTILRKIGGINIQTNVAFVNKSESAYCLFEKGEKIEHQIGRDKSIITEVIKKRRKFISHEPHRYWNPKYDKIHGFKID